MYQYIERNINSRSNIEDNAIQRDRFMCIYLFNIAIVNIVVLHTKYTKGIIWNIVNVCVKPLLFVMMIGGSGIGVNVN